jgi:hypothetical protein
MKQATVNPPPTVAQPGLLQVADVLLPPPRPIWRAGLDHHLAANGAGSSPHADHDQRTAADSGGGPLRASASTDGGTIDGSCGNVGVVLH